MRWSAVDVDTGSDAAWTNVENGSDSIIAVKANNASPRPDTAFDLSILRNPRILDSNDIRVKMIALDHPWLGRLYLHSPVRGGELIRRRGGGYASVLMELHVGV